MLFEKNTSQSRLTFLIKPQYYYINSPYWSPYILFSTTWEKLFKHQDNLSLVIISLILITCTCYNALMWRGEIWCWSILWLTGLNLFFRISYIKWMVVYMKYTFAHLGNWIVPKMVPGKNESGIETPP